MLGHQNYLKKMKRYFYLTLINYLFLSVNTSGQNHEFNYILKINSLKDLFLVELKNPKLTLSDSVYNFVAYAPGMHIPLNYGRLVERFRAFDNNGLEIETQKIGINKYFIKYPKKVSQINYSINDSFDYVPDNNVTISPMAGTGITDKFIFFNPYGIFGYFDNHKRTKVKLKLDYPEGMTVGTAASVSYKNIFTFKSTYEFYDSPFLISNNLSYSSMSLDNMLVDAYVYSSCDSIKANEVINKTKRITEAAADFIGYSPVDKYSFIMFFLDKSEINEIKSFNGGGALEHSYSSVYAFPENPLYLNYLDDLFSHEFMHILSPLHLHSNILADYDYSKPLIEDKHIWLYEGVTVWASYMMRVNKGLISSEKYLQLLSRLKRNSQKYDKDFSLIDISQKWHTSKGHKQYSNVYNRGVLTASMLDIRLLQLSKGKYGLQDLYLNLIKKYGKDKSFNNDSLFMEVIEQTYPEIEKFIKDHIENTKEFDYSGILRNFGVEYIETDYSKGQYGDLGFIVRNVDKKIVIDNLLLNYESNKLKVKDILVSVNNEKIDHKNYKRVLEKINNDNKYIITVLRDGNVIDFKEITPSCFIINKQKLKNNSVYRRWVKGKSK